MAFFDRFVDKGLLGFTVGAGSLFERVAYHDAEICFNRASLNTPCSMGSICNPNTSAIDRNPLRVRSRFTTAQGHQALLPAGQRRWRNRRSHGCARARYW